MDPPPSRGSPRRMELPPSGNGAGGINKYDFYRWLGCKVHALRNSSDLQFLLAVQVGDVRRLDELVNGLKEKDRAKLAAMHFDGTGLLHLAAFLGKLEAVIYFVERLGLDVDCPALFGGTTPLSCAAMFGEIAVAKYLLDHGANPNKKDCGGSVPLHSAVRSGCEELIRLLISRGAKVDMEFIHGTPLHVAASYGMFGAVEVLLEHNANPNSISEMHGTPLLTAIRSTEHGVRESDALKCLKLLVKAGADFVNLNSALAVVVKMGLTGCISVLLEAGANFNIPDHTSDIDKKLNDKKAELKKEGETATKNKRYSHAIDFYSLALELDRFDQTLYSNRSLCYLKVGMAEEALLDAEVCIRIQPDWVKAHYRKGAALMSLKEYAKAYNSFMDAMALEPGNSEISRAIREARDAVCDDNGSDGSGESK